MRRFAIRDGGLKLYHNTTNSGKQPMQDLYAGRVRILCLFGSENARFITTRF